MAAGILAVGLSMVASVFPVAVDQSRQAREATEAAFCARSVMAQMRADRVTSLGNARLLSNRQPFYGMTKEFWPATGKMSDSTCTYNPDLFLYEKDRTWPTGDMNRWSMGNYTADVFATAFKDGGPWRVTVLVYRSRGKRPSQESWEDAGTRAGPGEYLYPYALWGRGEAHLIDRITEDPDVPVLADGVTADPNWYGTPGTVAAFHTVFGE
jgi:hypothetical protein